MASATHRAAVTPAKSPAGSGWGEPWLGLAEPSLAELPGARGPQLATARGRAESRPSPKADVDLARHECCQVGPRRRVMLGKAFALARRKPQPAVRLGSRATVARGNHTRTKPTISCRLARYAGALNLPVVMKLLARMLATSSC